MSIFSSRRSESEPETLRKIRELQYQIMDLTQALPPFRRLQMLVAKHSVWTPVTCLFLTNDREGLGVTPADLDDANSAILIGKVGNPSQKWQVTGIMYLSNEGTYRDRGPVGLDEIKVGDTLPERYRSSCLGEERPRFISTLGEEFPPNRRKPRT